jgi:hypothetical protein
VESLDLWPDARLVPTPRLSLYGFGSIIPVCETGELTAKENGVGYVLVKAGKGMKHL